MCLPTIQLSTCGQGSALLHSTSCFDQRLMKEEGKEGDKEVKEGAIVSN